MSSFKFWWLNSSYQLFMPRFFLRKGFCFCCKLIESPCFLFFFLTYLKFFWRNIQLWCVCLLINLVNSLFDFIFTLRKRARFFLQIFFSKRARFCLQITFFKRAEFLQKAFFFITFIHRWTKYIQPTFFFVLFWSCKTSFLMRSCFIF